jgi:Aerotolerance regulator N-terminal
MEFLNPTALYGLLGLPLLLIPYLLRRKPRRYVFSSLFIFTAMGADPNIRPPGRLRLPLIFFLQLLLLTLMILALAEPVFTARPSRVAMVIDNSASMQALDGGTSRFALAQENAAAILTELGAGVVLDLYLSAPRLERFGATSFTPFEARRALGGLNPVDLGEAPLDYGNALGQLAREHNYDRVYLITDRPAQGKGGAVRVVTVGKPRANLAIMAFGVHYDSLTDARLSANAEVANFSSDDARVKITVRGGGAPLATRELAVASGAHATASFDGLPLHPYYEAEIEARDALALDNRRFAIAPATKKLHILGISPRPQELASLRAIAGVELDIVAPGDYEKTERSRYGLEIFHFSVPAALPRNPALFILPPNQNQLADLLEPAANPSVSGWSAGHPLIRYINFSLFRPGYARVIKPKLPGESIIRSLEGPLAQLTTKHGVNYLVLGFDPLPYLGQENLPMSIFTMNMVDWFFAFSGEPDKATGDSVKVSGAQPGDQIITPAGERISLRPGATILYQGIYQLVRQSEKSLFAANLRDFNESDLRQPVPIGLGGESNGGSDKSTLLPFWPYFLLAALLLLLLEWFINPRMARYRRRVRFRASAPSRT